MHTGGRNKQQTGTEKKPGILLAVMLALGLHAVILLLPIGFQTPPAQQSSAQIELQLSTFETQLPEPPVIESQPETPPDPPAPDPVPEPVAESGPIVVESIPEPDPEEQKSPVMTSLPPPVNPEQALQRMNELDRTGTKNAILMRQFIKEKSAADQLFGKPLPQYNSEPQKEFHYPVRPNMITMLDKPLPNLPLDYTPGLIHFAYDPGVKGDLQRFWDVITPEFGWRTKYGTEVKCIWVLVIAACGWK
jgi:hypothetical protein